MKTVVKLVCLIALAIASRAQASIAYGSINNFDCVNDTGSECHGFEIEIDDIHCTDITYTYDWNHYGPPKITEDKTDPLHPKVFVRHESAKNPDGTWAAYTAIPAGPITPTDGHQFTDPSVNFGGEHFGVGYYGTPTAVKYNWLVDDGTGHLAYGGVVNISTPVFSYAPPAAGQPAQVQAAIVPVPQAPVRAFGDATWVKETRTQAHNNNKVELKDLVSDDPANPNEKNWKNGEADEVEVEWRLLQTEFSQDNGGKNGELAGAPEGLAHGDEVITRRYDFYKYTGPIDPETGEAKADNVGPDGIHGNGIVVEDGVTTDYSNYIVVGDYIGAQMAGFDAGGQLGLIDHVQDGEINLPYIDRRMVIAGTPPITTTITGALPSGMTFNAASGILSGTPTVSGVFHFTLHSTDAAQADVTKSYDLNIVVPGAGEGEGEGEGQGGGLDPYDLLTPYSYFGVGNNDLNNDGVCDTEQLTCFSTAVSSGAYPEVNNVYLANRAQAAADIGAYVLQFLPGLDSLFGAWEMLGFSPLIAEVYAGNPGLFAAAYDTNNYNHTQDVATAAIIDTCNVPSCAAGPVITTSSSPAEGGTTTGGGIYVAGDSVTVAATANAGFTFVNWTEGGVAVSDTASYTFTADANHDLVANFAHVTYTIATGTAPAAGGSASGGGVKNSGDSVTVTATPSAGYNFANWTEGGAVVSTTASYTFTASADRNLVANFTRITYTIGTSAAPAAGGSTSGGGVKNSGDSVTVTATANAGYNFANWTEGGAVVSTAASYTFTASANRSLVANFVRITYTISTSAAPAAGGSTSGGGVKNSGDSVTVTATANAGYKFSNWTEGGIAVSTAASYTFTATANRTLVANFARLTYTVTLSASPTAGGTVSGGGTKNSGDSVTVTATASAGYKFVSWTEGGAAVSTSASYTFTASANRTLVATFARITYTISTSASPTAGGSTSGGGTVNSGTSVTVKATAAAGYSFVNWTENGVAVSTSASYSFTAGANRTLVANFAIVVNLTQVTVTSPVVGGNTTPGTVTLNAPAPAGGKTVTLSSSSTTVLTVPASVVVPAGQVSVGFTATTKKVTSSKSVTVTATLGSTKKTASVTVTK